LNSYINPTALAKSFAGVKYQKVLNVPELNGKFENDAIWFSLQICTIKGFM